MSGFIYQSGHQSAAWQRYIEHERAARDAYLQTTHRAHFEYLTGPWPDREAYNHVELSAWTTYYAAGRAAWRTFVQEITPPPPPPTPIADQSAAAAQFEQDLMSQRHWGTQPTYTPTDGGNQ